MTFIFFFISRYISYCFKKYFRFTWASSVVIIPNISLILIYRVQYFLTLNYIWKYIIFTQLLVNLTIKSFWNACHKMFNNTDNFFYNFVGVRQRFFFIIHNLNLYLLICMIVSLSLKLNCTLFRKYQNTDLPYVTSALENRFIFRSTRYIE